VTRQPLILLSKSSRAAGALRALLRLLLLAPGHSLAEPRLVLTPPQLQLSITSSAPVPVTLHNQGDTPLVLHAVALSPDSSGFSIVADAADPAAQVPARLQPGETLAPQAQRRVFVRYQPTPGRQQAYGALLIYSDDPRGQDDPRSEIRDHVHSLPLSAGESTAALWLWLAPLLAGLGATLLRACSPTDSLRLRARLTALLLLSGVLPVGLLTYLALTLVRGFGVAQGNYGYQHLLQRVLSTSPALSYHAGVDGLSLLLAVAIATWGMFSTASPLRSLLQSAWPATCAPLPSAATIARHTLRLSAALALITTLDVVPLGLALLAVQVGIGAGLPDRQRRIFAWVVTPSLLVLFLGLGWLVTHSQPTLLSNGRFVEHTTDVVKLSYHNYFADRPLWSGSGTGIAAHPFAPILYWVLSLTALMPATVLAAFVVRAPLAVAHQALMALALAAVVGFHLLVRVVAGMLPQSHSLHVPGLAALALATAVIAALPSLLRRSFPPPQRVPGLPLLLPLVGAMLGLASATATGILAALLLLIALSAAAPWLSLCLSALPPRPPCTPQHCPPPDQLRASESPQAPALRAALLLWTAPPGTLTFLAHALVALAAFAALRGLSLLYMTLWLLSQLDGLLSLWARPHHCPSQPGTRSLSAGWLLVLASALAGFCARPLLELGHTWSLDFISHTGHASGPPGPGFLARK